MRGRKTLLIAAVGLALVLLLLALALPRSRTAEGGAREPARSDGTAPEPAEPSAPERTAADVSLLPGPRHTGVEPDGTLGRGALLVGDSLTAGLAVSMLSHGTLGEARYIGIPSFSLQSFDSAPYRIDDDAVAAHLAAVCSPEFDGLSLAGAVRQAGRSVEALYFMLGTNQSGQVTAEEYTKTLRFLLDCCPNATVYAQTIPYSRGGLSEYKHVNAIIWESVAKLRHEGVQRVFVLDTFTAIGQDHTAADGVHLLDAGLVAWRDAIVDNAQKNQ